MTLPRAEIDVFADWGIRAFTTRREAGTFGFNSDEPAHAVAGRWDALQTELFVTVPRIASGHQVHGARIVEHAGVWSGWLRVRDTDGHLARARGTALAVSVADCAPVFVGHPSGATALLHSGWRGTEAGITERAVQLLAEWGIARAELRIYLGPAICGRCYEVSPEVYGHLTGTPVDRPTTVDLRALIAARARAAGVRDIVVDGACTRCDNDRFFSHRAGDPGRQLGVMLAPA